MCFLSTFHACVAKSLMIGDEENVNLTTDMLCIGCYAPNNPLHSVAKNDVGLKDFTDKSLQLTTHNLHTRSEG